MKYQYSILSLAIFAACYSQSALADLKSQCLLGVPQFQGEIIEENQTQLPVYIEADSVEVNQANEAIYTGDVRLNQGNRSLVTEQIRIKEENDRRLAFLSGHFDYRDHYLKATGREAEVNLSDKSALLQQVDYQFVGKQGRGSTESANLGNDRRVMKGATFTACLPGQNTWAIDASEMVQYVKEEYAELWHARFKVFGVPVFYTPYLQFPIGDRRRSGLLTPSVGRTSRDGAFYSQPIYWNIAPNVDATLTPTYYSRRGWKFAPELRYLTWLGNGKIAAEYIHRDRLPAWRRDEANKSRHLFFWQHNINFANNWRFSADYTYVSDRRYFSDFASAYGNSTDGYATQNFKLGYFQPNYNISLAAKKFQTFDESGSKPYRTFPQIDVNYYKNDLTKNTDFSLFGQLAHFANDSKKMPTVWRLHIEPSLNFPFANRFGSVNLQTKLYGTHYWQKAGKDENSEAVKRQVTRVLPQIKLDFKTTLQTNKPLFSRFTQIIEPRFQYLYRPYKDQSAIGSKRQTSLGLGYDSVLLQQDYFSLFNDRRYSGLDRIASANQITIGGTTRFFNEKGTEVFNLSAGQIYYLSKSRIDDSTVNSTANRSSSWSVESDWKFHPLWNWHGSYQYDTRLDQTSLANTSLQFKLDESKLVQVNYRYASQDYIDQNLSSNRYGQSIRQLGVIAGWDVSDNISIVASHYQDLALKKPVESQLNLNYSSCCWKATVYSGRRLTSTPSGEPDSINHFYYENHVGFNFELRFNGGNSNSVSKMLKRGIIPYTEGFNLN